MFDPLDTEQLEERLEALRAYASDIDDLEVRLSALKGLRDVVISGLVTSGVSTRRIADAAGISHVRVAAIAKESSAA